MNDNIEDILGGEEEDDFVIDEETDALLDQLDANFIPFKPDRRGRLPEGKKMDESWSHYQKEAVEVLSSMWMQDDKNPKRFVANIWFQLIDQDSPGFGRKHGQWFEFRKKEPGEPYAKRTQRSMQRIRGLLDAGGIEPARNESGRINFRRTISGAYLVGARVLGTLRQGCREGWTPETGNTGEYYPVKEFVEFESLDG